MKEVYEFIELLAKNNNKEWFEQHKNEYKDIQQYFNSFVEKLIYEISLWDKDINPDKLSVKQCTYRIYRDTRFSKNKLPYKTHIGAYICKEGKKSPFGGYYFHIEPKGLNTPKYLDGNLLATGLYCPEPIVVKSLRDEISVNGDSFLDALALANGFNLDLRTALKRVPRGFKNIEERWNDLIRLRDFSVYKILDNKFLFEKNLLEQTAKEFKKTYAFNKLLNLAVEYALEDSDLFH